MEKYLKIVFFVQIFVIAVLVYYSIQLRQKQQSLSSHINNTPTSEHITESTSNPDQETLIAGFQSLKNTFKGLWKRESNHSAAHSSSDESTGNSAYLANTLEKESSLVVSVEEEPTENPAQNLSDLLFSLELYDLPAAKTEVFSHTLGSEYEDIKRRFSPDAHLSIIKYGSDDFKNSTLRDKLNQVLTIKLYVIVRFHNAIDFPMISRLKRAGFSPLNQFPLSEYIDKKLGVFYVRYHKLLPAVSRLTNIADVYILTQYTARGFYQLGMKSLAVNDNLELQINIPFSKNGRELLYKKNTIAGTTNFSEKASDPLKSLVSVPFAKGQIVTFHSDLSYKIDLEQLVDTHIIVQGKNYTIKPYLATMQEQAPEIHQEFTQFSEKIVPSAYIDSLIRRIDTNAPISDLWKQLTRILDREINYDWQKRDLFFSGNLTYYNIKDMYMTAEELGRKRVGACTERTALEIAVLRKLGIASRAATRLYHIYTEIYIPNAGWTTTSLTLNEIPLNAAADENMSYFVSWEPNHPIRLKWEGYLYPNIIY
ncbi:hypothetical protein COTS27_00207 [Spirochaetota bacterium]|nr:hypothetical protein COTS27_00207 [Spirochaetota bacterium]